MLRITPKKNIVLFSIDSRRRDLYQTFGGAYPSPNMDRMAKMGIQLNNMYAPAASTVMTLSAIINGRYCHEFDRDVYPDPDPFYFEDNIFTKFADSGRRNFIIFQDLYIKDYADGIYNGPNVERVEVEDYCPSIKAALHIIDIAKKTDEPFFIMSHTSTSEPEVTDAIPENVHQLERFVKSDDDSIGLLLDNLNLDDTTLIFYSDHGYMKGEHNLISHAFYLYEGLLRVPCLITADEKQIVDEKLNLVQLYDLMLGKEISEPEFMFADTQYKGQPHRITSVISGDWKYIAHYNQQTAIHGAIDELYNLKDDPNELRNLLNDFSRHPLRPDWNVECLNKMEKSYLYPYNQDYLHSNKERLLKKLCEVWVKNLIEILVKVEGKQKALAIKKRILTLQPSEQIVVIRDVVKNFDQLNNYLVAKRKSDFLATKDK